MTNYDEMMNMLKVIKVIDQRKTLSVISEELDIETHTEYKILHAVLHRIFYE